MRYLLLMCVALFIAGCSGTKESAKTTPHSSDDAIRSFEAGFQPSDHDPMKLRALDHGQRRTDSSAVVLGRDSQTASASEAVQGFRVQVYSSTEIDAARSKKAEFEAAFPDEWFYLNYQAPTYKLRAGNFLTRFEAERFARLLTDQGYREAWTVPESVLRTPGKRPPVPPPAVIPEPQR